MTENGVVVGDENDGESESACVCDEPHEKKERSKKG